MNKDYIKYTCVLWISAVILICTRYLCASIMVAGALGDRGTYNMALDSLGPFLPILSVICLCGGLLFSATQLIAVLRDRKK